MESFLDQLNANEDHPDKEVLTILRGFEYEIFSNEEREAFVSAWKESENDLTKTQESVKTKTLN